MHAATCSWIDTSPEAAELVGDIFRFPFFSTFFVFAVCCAE
jgi:hypothetical protein